MSITALGRPLRAAGSSGRSLRAMPFETTAHGLRNRTNSREDASSSVANTKPAAALRISLRFTSFAVKTARLRCRYSTLSFELISITVGTERARRIGGGTNNEYRRYTASGP